MEEKQPDPAITLGQRAFGVAKEWGFTLFIVAIAWQVLGAIRAPDLPDMAPNFTLSQLDGGEVSLSDLRGQVVVLNFWATWCPPCRVEAPSFDSFANAHPDIPVLGIAVDGQVDELKLAASELGISYPVLVANQKTLDQYQIETMPTTVIVGPDGDVFTSHSGLLLRPQLELMVLAAK